MLSPPPGQPRFLSEGIVRSTAGFLASPYYMWMKPALSGRERERTKDKGQRAGGQGEMGRAREEVRGRGFHFFYI